MVIRIKWIFWDQYDQHLVVIEKNAFSCLGFHQLQAQDVLLYFFVIILHFNTNV